MFEKEFNYLSIKNDKYELKFPLLSNLRKKQVLKSIINVPNRDFVSLQESEKNRIVHDKLYPLYSHLSGFFFRLKKIN